MMARGSMLAVDQSSTEENSVASFLRHEMSLLDESRFEEWIDLFAEDGIYWAPINPNQESPKTHVSLFFDDKKAMRTRVNRLRHPRIHCQTPPSRMVHLASNLLVSDHEEGRLRATCNFIVLEYRQNQNQNIWGGSYEYRLIPSNGPLGYQIDMKKAQLINSDGQFPSLAVWF